MIELEVTRAPPASGLCASGDDCRTTVLAKKDAVQGIAWGAVALDGRRTGVEGDTLRFKYNTYPVHARWVLARFWCHKLQHFMNLELLSADGEKGVLSIRPIAMNTSNPWRSQFLFECGQRPTVLQRVTQNRAMRR